jgi:predicted GH43/DUF377 family glycosyl hydrolase
MTRDRWPAARRGVAVVAVLLSGVLSWACGAAFEPKQAQFAVSGCEGGAPLDVRSLAWKWQAAPVLGRGPQGEWDAADVLNPSVVRVAGAFYNLYSGFDGRIWHTGLAVSRDGLSWEKQGRVLSPDATIWEADYIAANGSVLHDGSRFLYWYQAGERGRTRIGLASSEDARSWQKHPEPVLELGAPGSWDEAGLGDPYLIGCGDSYYLYYLGQNRRGLQRLGVARSQDGVHWQKSGSNPILDVGVPGSFDERGLGEPAVFVAGGRFYMLYTGRDAAEQRRIGWAQSGNGVDWERIAHTPLLEGFADWNSRVVCDPAVWRDGARILVWFGGGDEASPDENLNGQIGLAWIEPHGGETRVEARE